MTKKINERGAPSGPYPVTKLSNHLQVLTVPMKDRESAAVAIWARVGGRYEPRRLSGISHFLEHMLFKGTRRRTSQQIKREVEGVGGALNAFTGEESTCYFAKLLVRHFPRAFDVLSDMIKEASLDIREMDRERTVILEEIKMYRDQPSQYVHELMGELLWPDQPLGRSLAGTAETVAAIHRKDMAEYKQKYYQPQNILVSVSGAVSHGQVLELARKYFSPLKAGKGSRFKKARAVQAKPRFQFVEKDTEQTHLVIGFHGLSKRDPRRYALGVLNILLGANMSSRLFEEVREKRGLAYEIRSSVGHYQDTGSVTVSAGVENRKAADAIEVILRELGKVARRPVGRDELRRAKEYFLAQFLMGLEDTLDHLLWVGEKLLYSDEVQSREEIAREIEKVTREDVQSVAKQIFQTARANLTLIGPLKEKGQGEIKRSFEIG